MMERAQTDMGDTFIIDRGYRLQSSIDAHTLVLSAHRSLVYEPILPNNIALLNYR